MNRKQILSGATIAAFAAILLAWAPSASVQAEPATVGMGTTGCALLDGDGNIISSDEFQSVETNNGKGTGKLTCKAFDVPNNTGKAVHWDFNNTGLLCNGSENWKIVVSQNEDGTTGDATMQCRFR